MDGGAPTTLKVPRARDDHVFDRTTSRAIIGMTSPATRRHRCRSTGSGRLRISSRIKLRLRAHPVDQEGMMTLLITDCRKDLEESLDYLADYWQEDLDIPPEEMTSRLEEVAPDVFEEE